MKAVVENWKKELDKSRERMKKYVHQSRIEPPSFQLRNAVMLKRNNFKTPGPARKLQHTFDGPFEIHYIICPPVVCLRLTKTWKINPVFYGSLIDPFIMGNRDFDLNTILKTSDPIENPPEYHIDKVMGSTIKRCEGIIPR
jgi:hypothetical protein